jgi:hypothetical protein
MSPCVYQKLLLPQDIFPTDANLERFPLIHEISATER